MPNQLNDLLGPYVGRDIYVIGSGKSLDYYPAGFFDDRVTIGVNQGWANRLDSVDVMVTKYHENALEWADSDRVGHVVVTKGQRGHRGPALADDPRLVIVDHNPNTVDRFTLQDWPTDPLALVATHSSITTAMHLACLMGARSVFVVGADCGDLDGERNMTGHDTKDTTLDTLASFDRQNTIVKAKLWELYRVPIVGLSPFVTPNMEGHRYVSHFGTINAS